jgi:hypothetical protein
VVGDDWAVRKWSEYHIISMSDGTSAMLKRNMLTTGWIGAEPKSLLEWISTYDYRAAHDYFSRQRQPNTGEWISETFEFKRWFDGRESACFWCSGIRK